MRPRQLLVLLGVAAVPVALAVALSTGGGSPAAGNTGIQASLHLVGGTSVGGVRACGIVHHYRAYSSGSRISFRGVVVPADSGALKVKVKLKVCTAGTFEPAGDAATVHEKTGSFRGSFPAPIAGYYFARAEVERAGGRVARTDKYYFAVR
jgi:hypothetical protein